MTIKDKLEEALIKGEEFYINTPTFSSFSYIINLLTSDELKSYVPRMKFDLYNHDMWNIYSENTYLFYWKNDNFAYGGKNATNDKNRYFLDLFNLKEEIIEHTYTISIGEYSGKLIISKEALELLKTGNKIKIV